MLLDSKGGRMNILLFLGEQTVAQPKVLKFAETRWQPGKGCIVKLRIPRRTM